MIHKSMCEFLRQELIRDRKKKLKHLFEHSTIKYIKSICSTKCYDEVRQQNNS